MKLITAIIRAEKLDEVRQSLVSAEITRITVSRCSGRGHRTQRHLPWTGSGAGAHSKDSLGHCLQ